MDFLKGKVDSVKETVSDGLDGLKAQLEKEIAEKEAMVKRFEQEKRAFVMNYIYEKLDGIFDHAMNVAAGVAKQKIKDPYMPNYVQGLCDEMVDNIMPDVKLELKDEILKGITSKHTIAHGMDPGCPKTILAFFRYYLIPYDRSIWRQLRNPLWWLFTLVSLVPVYSVMQIVYFLKLLLIDKGDEFQLFQYIQDFKGMQFFTLGVVGSAAGSVQYYICVTRTPTSCPNDSPRESFWSMVIFCFQVVFVFVAFLLMNCSEKKGGFFYQFNQKTQQEIGETIDPSKRVDVLQTLASGDADETDKLLANARYKSDEEMLRDTRNGLAKFIIYDLIIFIICIGLICLLAFYNALDQDSTVTRSEDRFGDNNWKFVMGLYWVKCLYGFMSFPFLALRLPLVSTLISHAKPTGYNPYGLCVPYLGKEEDGPVPWDPERKTKAEKEEASKTTEEV